MAQGDPMKWHMPGWRIEQRFAPGVLIGNWGEERYTVSFPVNSAAVDVHAHSLFGILRQSPACNMLVWTTEVVFTDMIDKTQSQNHHK